MHTFEKLAMKLAQELMPDSSEFEPDSVREFITQNISYVRNRGYSDSDLRIVAKLREAIESRLGDNVPLPGDSVRVIGRRVYEKAIVTEGMDGPGQPSVCVNGSTHVCLNRASGEIYTSTSGGYFSSAPVEKFVRNPEPVARIFWAWGRFGAGASQGVYFSARVNSWTLRDDSFY